MIGPPPPTRYKNDNCHLQTTNKWFRRHPSYQNKDVTPVCMTKQGTISTSPARIKAVLSCYERSQTINKAKDCRGTFFKTYNDENLFTMRK